MRALIILLLACSGSPCLTVSVEAVPGTHAGSVDESFRPALAADGYIRCLLPLPNGQILVSGNFRTWNGLFVPSLVRLNADGSLDPKFQPQLSIGSSTGLSGLWQDRDGKILIAGGFESVNQKPRRNFARLTAEGEDDPTFSAFVDGEVNDVALAPDGTIVIVGAFKTANGLSLPGVARLSAQGQPDPAFQPPLNLTGTAVSVIQLTDGDVLVAGVTANQMDPPLYGLVRLSSKGEIDPGYYLESPSFFARRLECLPGGAQVLGHGFGVVRLMPDGGLDALLDFSRISPFGPTVTRALPDGRLLVAAENLTGPDGSPARLLRLFQDGRIDTSFQATLDFTPESIGLEANGLIYAAGHVFGPQGDQKRLVRLRSHDPSAPAAVQWNAAQLGFPAAGGAAVVTLVRDGSRSEPCSVQVAVQAAADWFAPFDALVPFAPGESFKTISIPGPLRPPAGPEQLAFAELRAAAGATLGTNRSLALHFYQDQGTIDLGQTSIVASEPAGSITVQARRQGALAYSVRSSWTVQSAATDPAANFGATSGSVLFPPGSTNTFLTIRLVDNPTAAGDKTFSLQLGSVSAHFQLRNPAQCDITVLENDQPGFPGDGIDAPVQQLAVQADGKVLLGGFFRSVNGRPRDRFARLSMDGTLDETFQASLSVPPYSDSRQDLQPAPDGKVVISGGFTNISGVSISQIARLNPNGSLDTTFNPVPNLSRSVTGLAVTPDGQVLAIGDGTDFNGARAGLSLGAIAKFQIDGRRDTNFATSTYGGAESKLLPLTNGRFIAGGSILVYSNALPAGRSTPKPGVPNPVLRRALARFEPTGQLDITFNASVLGQGGTRRWPSPVITAMQTRADGRLLVAGGFTNVNGQPALGLVQLLPDGAIDPTFQPEIARVAPSFSAIRSIALGPNDKLAAVIEDGGAPVRLVQFNADGKLDQTFGVHQAPNSSTVVAILPNGDVVWAGNFTSVDGSRRYRLARFHPDSVLAPDGALGLNLVPTGAGAFRIQLESRAAGRVQLEKSNNLKTWTPIATEQIAPGLNLQSVPAPSAQSEFYRAVFP